MDVTSEPQTKGFHNDSFIPTLTTYEYRGYMIGAWARPEFANGFTSVGIVYERSKLGSIIHVQELRANRLKVKSRPSNTE
jgi:hypothetical protein